MLGIYFVWFWSHGGQTLAMKTWHIRLVTATGEPVTPGARAAALPAELAVVLPALAAAVAVAACTARRGDRRRVLASACVAYALLALLHPQRQFWHDALCGTRLVHLAPAARDR